MDVNGSSVVFDIDEFAHIETAADGTQTIWTPQGEKELVAAPEYTTASLEAAGFGAEKNPQSATVEAQNIVVTGQKVFGADGRELIVVDPTQQSIPITLVDPETLTSQEFGSLLTAGTQ